MRDRHVRAYPAPEANAEIQANIDVWQIRSFFKQLFFSIYFYVFTVTFFIFDLVLSVFYSPEEEFPQCP